MALSDNKTVIGSSAWSLDGELTLLDQQADCERGRDGLLLERFRAGESLMRTTTSSKIRTLLTWVTRQICPNWDIRCSCIKPGCCCWKVIDFNKYQDPDHAFELKSDYEATASAAASRHWYKTACAATSNLNSFRSSEGILSGKEPVRLPGSFSVRGDWFLGVARGSRSYSLADKALDLLTSRRANRTRLHLGLGLPVRDVLVGQNLGRIRTRLSVLVNKSNLKQLEYGELLRLGVTASAQKEEGKSAPQFRWAFRSAFDQFDRHSRVIQKWIHRMLAWTVEYRNRTQLNSPANPGFVAYDAITNGQLRKDLPGMMEFVAGLDVFVDDLNAATVIDPLPSGGGQPTTSAGADETGSQAARAATATLR